MEEVVEVELDRLQMVDQEDLVEVVQMVVVLLQEQDLEDQEFNLLNLEIQELLDLVILEEMPLHLLVEVQVAVEEQELQVVMQQFQILEMGELVNQQHQFLEHHQNLFIHLQMDFMQVVVAEVEDPVMELEEIEVLLVILQVMEVIHQIDQEMQQETMELVILVVAVEVDLMLVHKDLVEMVVQV